MKCKLIILLVGVLLAACSDPGYRGASIEGDVVDAETGLPIEGVVVVTLWELVSGMHDSELGILWADEALTDAKGHFYIPPWGPIKSLDGNLEAISPWLVFFKNGYSILAESNDIEKPGYNPEVWQSEHNRKQFALSLFKGSLKEYGEETTGLRFFLRGSNQLGDICYWQKIPMFTKAVLDLRKVFEEQKIYHELPSADSLARLGKCGNPKMLLGRS
jgi:hypothetical protein